MEIEFFFWNRGHATEAAFVCLNYGFEQFEFPKIVSFTSILNIRSESVMKKIGLKKVRSFYHPNLPAKHRLIRAYSLPNYRFRMERTETFFLLIFSETEEMIC
ncbi:GNAT family N-acetyltransferase [Leptospira kirschneri]|uniref:Toxin-antitoxin system, toxin component, GNAT domain protein n=1 Tax=Leptospira kirschneri serovar Bulgarica str. Nikolaevo TaxID=1240687 RepID=M6FCK5_9LEPT|nr:GNAT family N-acetyltransferase [Leptospira kirschneri]EMK24792.1 toxin-antitoxin system, toxin component, GNAT domain protein [Leptospira kirschneri serovar Bulgarica str. Nikolaevo]